jgi:hypothetical protein
MITGNSRFERSIDFATLYCHDGHWLIALAEGGDKADKETLGASQSDAANYMEAADSRTSH